MPAIIVLHISYFHIEDMTRQKEIELALESADHKFKGIFENANDGITISGA